MIRVVHPGSRIRMLTFYPSWIPAPGSRGQKGTGSRIRIRNTDLCNRFSVPSSELAPPTPSPASECVPPWNQRGGGGNICLWVRGRGEPILTNGEKAWHSMESVYSVAEDLGRAEEEG